ncbi:cytochrome-c oxidase, cbb3-type subunit II [Helicobacter kayseriensis]|uniref:cytochrome-c oxidase, cbb3-type subunit II n=1 Tax=Helicobacter kayseriensis TaxID=2905877 RepID=UPI001E2D4401|nr:cytochrome-c oxidase, cbb3-type subunit II [Helicobacter kayseriensis]MCE3047064.1 cytochrome-c oxidase, cbb3-type subunit II [Helicobacter kayseriensis]MCE3048276.1 cytochrome-c oxidase, cbb3-type subunit II [Helicobacter kayseriensis]
MFGWLERNPFFFSLAFVFVFSIAGLVEILPGFAKTARPLEGLRPYSVLETAGRQVYIEEGCYNCHSQLVRPFKAETDRYGPYSLSGEYAYDRPFLWGSKRTGPDLHRVGDNRSTDWHDYHMWDPTSVVPGSIMPAYKHLYKNNADFETAYAEAYTQKVVFAVPYDIEGGVKLGDIQMAKELFYQEAEKIVADMKNEQVKEAFQKGEIKKIVALIAYLNSLGQSRMAPKGE